MGFPVLLASFWRGCTTRTLLVRVDSHLYWWKTFLLGAIFWGRLVSFPPLNHCCFDLCCFWLPGGFATGYFVLCSSWGFWFGRSFRLSFFSHRYCLFSFFCGALPSKPELESDLKILALSGWAVYHLPQVSTSIWVVGFYSYLSPYGFWIFLPTDVPWSFGYNLSRCWCKLTLPDWYSSHL